MSKFEDELIIALMPYIKSESMQAAKMPIQTVSKLLGHNSIETTQIYLDVSDDELGAAHAKYVI